MSQRALRETTIERIYREVTGRKMPYAVRLVLLGKRKHQDAYPKTSNFDWKGLAETGFTGSLSSERESSVTRVCSFSESISLLACSASFC
jgi:hypothetical protein